ncbi:hypothetical protein [Streptomyces sp. NPDC004728]|uniref:hypothetical protein n=1 Tax=Streptomyces sp. NPDC004728 TaxID=3154289 RepID=UPI0033B98F19
MEANRAREGRDLCPAPRGREYLVALKAEDSLLTLHSLHWADEIRDPIRKSPDLPDKMEPIPAEVKIAHQFIDALTTEWDPEDFTDTFQEKVEALIEAKAAGGGHEEPEPAAKPTGVVDLMETLRAGVERARSPKDTREKTEASGQDRAREEACREEAGSSTRPETSVLTDAPSTGPTALRRRIVPGRNVTFHPVR